MLLLLLLLLLCGKTRLPTTQCFNDDKRLFLFASLLREDLHVVMGDGGGWMMVDMEN
jgi:hypothetical protein